MAYVHASAQTDIRAGRTGPGGFLRFYVNNTADPFTPSDGIEAMRIATNGNVGIGAPPGNYKLLVNGTAAKPGGGEWTDASDERLKKNIKPLISALDRMLGCAA
jgi:hypothetical protein